MLLAIAAAASGVSEGVAFASPAQRTIASPDGSVRLVVSEEAGALSYRVTRGGSTVIDKSRLGIVTGAADLSTGLAFTGSTTRAVNQSYDLVAKTNGRVTSSATETTLNYSKGSAALSVVVRAQRGGVALRYVVSGVGSTAVTGEETAFALPSSTSVWAAPYSNNYEAAYRESAIADIGTTAYGMPVLGRLPGSAGWLLISQAGVIANGTYPAVRLDGAAAGSRTLGVRLPGPDSNPTNGAVTGRQVPFSGTLTTPWRFIALAGDLQGITSTTLPTDLNPPSTADTSWIKPGTSLWSWLVNDTFSLGGAAGLSAQKEYVDSAERLGIPYVTVDSGFPGSAIPQLAAHARQRGVGIFVWRHSADFRNPDGSALSESAMDAAMKAIAASGVKGVKVDFFDSDRQQRILLYKRIAASAMTAKLMLNFHGSTAPDGSNRTYPNIVSTEAIAGNEWYRQPQAPTAANNAVNPFTRGALGGADYTPALISAVPAVTTQAHQLALAVVNASALTTLADSNADYETSVGRNLLRGLPTVWDESRLVDGSPGEYAAFARRSGGAWYIGAITTRARVQAVPLAPLLGAGSYTASVFADSPDGTRLVESTQSVTSASQLSLPLLPNGGVTVRITRDPVPSFGSADQVIEAEAPQNTLGGGAAVGACAGCSGGALVGYLNWGRSVTVPVTTGSAGDYTLRVGYAAGGDLPLSLSVNGAAPVEYVFPGSGPGSGAVNGWNVSRTKDIDVRLNAGSNALVFSSPRGSPASLDRVALLHRYEAEDPANTLTGIATRRSCSSADCSGQIVGELYNDSSVTFPAVTAVRAGPTSVAVRYIAGEPRYAMVSVNGGTATRVDFAPGADWSQTGVKTISLDLSQGSNRITFASDGWTPAPDIDRITVAQ
jgi:alpha-glucosidase